MISHKKTQTNKTKKRCTKRISKPVKKRKAKKVGNALCPNKTKNISKTCDDVEADNAHLKEITGIRLPDAGKLLLEQVILCMPYDLLEAEETRVVAMAMLLDIEPKDELEGMLAAQMIAVHVASMSMSKRCMLANQTFDGVNANVNRMTKLMRTFTNQIETLQRYRGKGKQTIQVQHVQVNDGGQAIVANVEGSGGNE